MKPLNFLKSLDEYNMLHLVSLGEGMDSLIVLFLSIYAISSLVFVALILYIMRSLRRKERLVSEILASKSQLDPCWKKSLLEEGIRQAYIEIVKVECEQDVDVLKKWLHPELLARWGDLGRGRSPTSQPSKPIDFSSLKVTIVDVHDSAESADDFLTARIYFGVRLKTLAKRYMWHDEAEFWTFRRMNGRWLLWNVYEFSAWKKFVFASKAQSVATAPMETFGASESHRKVTTRRKRKYRPLLMSIASFDSIVLLCSVIAVMTWTPINLSDFIRRIFLFILPVAVLLFVLTYSVLSARLQQVGVPYVHYYVMFFYTAVLSLQIPVFSVVIANGYGSYAEPVAFKAKVINKVARHGDRRTHYFAVLEKPERASCCTSADAEVSWKEDIELGVGLQEYRRINPGKTQMEVKVKEGLLGIPYLVSSRLLETETDTFDDRLEDNSHGEDDTSDEGVSKHKHNQLAKEEAERWDPQPPQNGGDKFRTSHWPNGAVRSKEPLVNGKVHGMAVMTWDNGNIYGRIPFRNGLKHGRFELFRRDGSRDQTLSYKDGRLHGKCTWYRKDGSLMAVAVYVDGKLVSNSNDDAR